MLDASSQARFARSCSDAMFGYANAATAACAAMTTQTFDMWAAGLRAMSPETPQPRSWYRHPDERARRATASPMLAPWYAAWLTPSGSSGALPSPFAPVPVALWPAVSPSGSNPAASLDGWMAPWATWFAMWSGPRAASAWPLACVMVANGMPQSVAIPAAEAHAAVLDAAGIASDHLVHTYSVYRSESGYATAQVIAPRRHREPESRREVSGDRPLAATPMTAMMWPWLH